MTKKACRIPNWGAAAALLMLFAGMTAAQGVGNWTQQVPSRSPSARSFHAMAYDFAHGQVVLFGGRDEKRILPLNDTWTWEGSNWTQKFPQNSPPFGYFAMAYDSAHGQMVLFGGEDLSLHSDTWTWDGANWTLKSPGISPSKRAAFAMAYDSSHSQVVLFGGDDEHSLKIVDDTWTWDGFNWAQKSQQNSPPARYGHAMAYDPAHGQVVLFGGINGVGSDFGDTWTWDGSNWTQKSPRNSPSARDSHAMAYDSAHGQVVLFGGYHNNVLNDTWTWDGSNWTQKSPQNSPSARAAHAMAYDSAQGQVVLFGGFFSIADLGDTWSWDGRVAGPLVIGGAVSASAFGGFSTAAPGSWVEIYGSNLAADTREWAGSDFNGNKAPTMLDGVQVLIGGQKAFVSYISSGQVNAQLPSNIGSGPMQITLTNAGITSAPLNITVNATAPGLQAQPGFMIGGNQYVVAQFADGTYVLPTGAISGVASRPAKPGETIVMYGVGFGSVIPNIPAGQIVTQANQLALPLQILFGQAPAQMQYFGLAPNFVGLYQFNVVVPAVANNDLVPLSFTLGGVAGTQKLYIAVQQ